MGLKVLVAAPGAPCPLPRCGMHGGSAEGPALSHPPPQRQRIMMRAAAQAPSSPKRGRAPPGPRAPSAAAAAAQRTGAKPAVGWPALACGPEAEGASESRKHRGAGASRRDACGGVGQGAAACAARANQLQSPSGCPFWDPSTAHRRIPGEAGLAPPDQPLSCSGDLGPRGRTCARLTTSKPNWLVSSSSPPPLPS